MRPFLGFIFKNLGPSIAFFVVFNLWGAAAAVSVAVGVTLIQSGVLRYRGAPLSPLFVLVSSLTVGFGVLSLLIRNPEFFRFEPAIQNAIVGSLFLISLWRGQSLIAWLSESLPVSLRPNLSHLPPDYLKTLTLAWSIQFFVKAVIYLYLAYQVNLGHLILLRTAIGWVFFGIMLGGDLLYRRIKLGSRRRKP